MTTFDNIEKAKSIWRLVLDVPPPNDRRLYHWLLSGSLEDFERACNRTRWRFKNEKFDAVKADAFITASLAWFRRKREEKHQ
jgi:hypothetical protein